MMKMFLSLILFYLFCSCIETNNCIVSLDNKFDFINLIKEEQDYEFIFAKIKNLKVNKSDLILFINEKNCLYLNKNKIQTDSISTFIYKYVVNNDNLSTYPKKPEDAKIFILLTSNLLGDNFKNLEYLYHSIRKSYVHLYKEYSLENFGTKDYKNLNEDKIKLIFDEYPIRVVFVHNYIQNLDDDYVIKKLIDLGAISPYDFNKGLE